jgi:hypothetical protein
MPRVVGTIEKITTLVAYAVFGILVLWGLVRSLGAVVGMILMFVNSPLPWSVLTPAAIALVVLFVFFCLFSQDKSGRKEPQTEVRTLF